MRNYTRRNIASENFQLTLKSTPFSDANFLARGLAKRRSCDLAKEDCGVGAEDGDGVAFG